MKGRFKMFFVIAIFNFLFFSLQIEAFNSSLLACKLALNPFSTFQPSQISKGDIERVSWEMRCISKKEQLQFLQKLKLAKICAATGVALSGVGISFYFRQPVGLIVIPMVCLPTAAYLSQFNAFKEIYL